MNFKETFGFSIFLFFAFPGQLVCLRVWVGGAQVADLSLVDPAGAGAGAAAGAAAALQPGPGISRLPKDYAPDEEVACQDEDVKNKAMTSERLKGHSSPRV